MTQWYKTATVDILLKWILLICDKDYKVKRYEGKIWLYNNDDQVVEYIDDPMENN